ncbi:MAG: hypothetical protein AAGH60_09005 [Pseudomonadota bacterium]
MRGFLSERRSGHNSLTTLAAICVAFVLSGCTTYGSFDENEPGLEESLLGDFAGVLGGGTVEDDIDYDARAPLVAPPNASSLPAPQEPGSAAINDPAWPAGSRERLAQVLDSDEQTLVFSPGVDGVDIAATQALASGNTRGRDDFPGADGERLTPEEMRQGTEDFRRRQEALGLTADGPRPRRFLTDPPVEARAPAPGGEEVIAEEEEDEGFDWWPFD